jgi:hypothetical protein
MSIQVGRQRVRVELRPGERAALAAAFAARHVVHLPNFLDPALLDRIDARLAAARFVPRVNADGVEIEQALDDEPLSGLFTIALNDPDLFGIVSAITDAKPIRCFTGRVYRRANDGGHYYPWHDDVSHGRLVGLSINLSAAPYTGGVLQLREAGSGRPIGEAANTGQGDAMLFRISPDLEHQVTPVTSQAPRLVLAGWFCSDPSYLELLRDRR